jgi:signal transduction histidine kinase
MDYQTTLATVARLAVPHIADWCAVDMLAENGDLNRVAVAHVDPGKVEYAYELQRRFPFDPEAPTGTAQVLRTGQSEFYPEINEAMLAATGADEEVLDIVRQLGLRSAITVPLRTFDQVLGVITLVWAETNQYYTQADLDLAEELARRAGVAVENARLYREAQQLNIELEKRVRERTASLEAANKELEAFSYTVSHDLRSPLRAIDGFSRVLLEQYSSQLTADAQRYLGMVRHGAQQMGQLIDDLLTFARLSRLPLRRQTVAPVDLIHQVLEELRVEREGRQIEFIINDLPLCQADPTLLKQVWFNLLANALKYSRHREVAKIEIGYHQAGEEPAYFVKDNGVGFDMQYADKLFGVFQRLHLAEEYEGTGVGLAIVQRIIHRHGGRTWAEAALDKGATFYFTLP